MPLPRLQWVGNSEDAFIYRINWSKEIRRSEFMDSSSSRNIIRFVGQAGEYLVRLAGLLRPLIQRERASAVARFNEDTIPDAQLDRFLFGAERVALTPVRGPLRDLQDNRCFYCDVAVRSGANVDHFIPWARWPNNDIENLVVADLRCNGAKSDHLAADAQLESWVDRLATRATEFDDIATSKRWDRHAHRSLGVARAILSAVAQRRTPVAVVRQVRACEPPAPSRGARRHEGFVGRSV